MIVELIVEKITILIIIVVVDLKKYYLNQEVEFN